MVWGLVLSAITLALMLLPGCKAGPAPDPAIPAGGPLTLNVSAIDLNPHNPAQIRVGSLLYKGGLELSSPDPRLGGLSGLWVSPDGERLAAVSDRGWRLDARLVYGEQGRLKGLANARMGPLLGPDGRPLAGSKGRADAEDLCPSPDGGLVVSLEGRHRLLAYPPGDPPLAGIPQRINLPGWLLRCPPNAGAEALAYLDDGRLLVLAEGGEKGGWLPGALGGVQGWRPVRWPMQGGFRPTAAASLPGGGVLVLERRHHWLGGLSARLRLVQGPIRPGPALAPRTLAVLAEPMAVDNFEGLAAARVGGRTYVFLLSDDNYSALQRTLLLAFELEEF